MAPQTAASASPPDIPCAQYGCEQVLLLANPNNHAFDANAPWARNHKTGRLCFWFLFLCKYVFRWTGGYKFLVINPPFLRCFSNFVCVEALASSSCTANSGILALDLVSSTIKIKHTLLKVTYFYTRILHDRNPKGILFLLTLTKEMTE